MTIMYQKEGGKAFKEISQKEFLKIQKDIENLNKDRNWGYYLLEVTKIDFDNNIIFIQQFDYEC